MQSRSKRFSPRSVAFLGLLTALAAVMGYVELRIPFHFYVPGVKLGLCNTVILLTLYLYGFSEALTVSLIRVILLGLLFGTPISMLYGAAGTVLSLSVMAVLKKTGRFSMIGVSVSGGVLHPLGQLSIAAFLTGSPAVFRYAPVLILAGEVTGAAIGILDLLIYRRIRAYFFREPAD